MKVLYHLEEVTPSSITETSSQDFENRGNQVNMTAKEMEISLFPEEEFKINALVLDMVEHSDEED